MDLVELRYQAMRCHLLASQAESSDEADRLNEDGRRYTEMADNMERLPEPA